MYGLVYVAGWLAAVLLRFRRFDFYHPSFFYALHIATFAALGAILGGRFGYVLFYEPSHYVAHPEEIYRLYLGGMSFFGGATGLVLALGAVHPRGFWTNLDHLCLLACLILPLGRIANFLNGELWGTVTDLPWGVIFEGADSQPRHPVQLYEAVLEGPLLLAVVVTARRILGSCRPEIWNRPGTVSLLFGFFYALFRFAVEFVREPDRVTGYAWLLFTPGHVLSLILMVAVALLFLLFFIVRGGLGSRKVDRKAGQMPAGGEGISAGQE